jgi:hypothetical protein
MATKVPRIAVTVTPELFAVVERLAELTHQTKSSILGEIAETARPVLEGMVSAAERFAALDASKQQDMLRGMESAEARIMADAERLQRETLDAFRGTDE